MADFIDRYELTKNLCKAICWRDAVLCVAEPKYCKQEAMIGVFNTPIADVLPVVHSRFVTMSGFPACKQCGASPAIWEPKPNNQSGYPPYCYNCGAKMDMESD